MTSEQELVEDKELVEKMARKAYESSLYPAKEPVTFMTLSEPIRQCYINDAISMLSVVKSRYDLVPKERKSNSENI